ncbi:MAG: hypothetical protein LBB81_10315 [Treponema sp.]|jgi:hypothetical protein|nr:hypothetical protein [Treponema sp.]
MKKIYPLLLLFFLRVYSHAQSTDAYLIPRAVYVGDTAALVLPLPDTAKSSDTIIFTPADPGFPYDKNIDFHRIIMERRTSGSRLLIEFAAFTPGILEFPAIEIMGERFTDLQVTINSIIGSNSGGLDLSGPASTLAAPGTGALIYGTLTACVLLVILLLWFALRGRGYLRKWSQNFKLWRLFTSIKNIERRLYRSLSRGAEVRGVLDKLSDEFRVFLSYYTACNCRTMTANELEYLPVTPGNKIKAGSLRAFFHQCDELRFSGTPASVNDAAGLLIDLRQFIGTLEKKEES